MFNDISKFFDNNLLYGIIIIICLCIILLYIINNKSHCPIKNEHMTSSIQQPLPKCTNSPDIKFNASYVGANKLINFKTTMGGKEYYLANVKMSECYPNDQTDPSKLKDLKDADDCNHVAMVLIEKSEIENMMQTYNKNLAIAKDTCNSSKKITCEHNLSHTPTPQDIQKCNIPDPSCNQHRKFIHDFNVIELIDSNFASPMRKYIVKGTAVPNVNDNAYPTMLNQSLFDEHNVNFLCGDTYNYGHPNLSKDHAELMIIERDILNNGGIIHGTGNEIRIKLRFNTRDQLISQDKDGKKILTPIMDSDGKVKKIGSYVGVCQNQQKTCKSYHRVCLYTDIINPNVLEFEPILADN